MKSGLVVEKRKLQQVQYGDMASRLQVKDEDEQKNTAKRRDVEGRHLESKLLGEDDCMESLSIKSEATDRLSSFYDPTPITLPVSSPPPVAIPTGPKASHCVFYRPPSLINIRTLCTPHNRSLSTREIEALAILQNRVDKAIAGTGPSLRILTNIPGSINLTVTQKQVVYAAQDRLDMAVLKNKMERGGVVRSNIRKAAITNSHQHDVRPWHDSNGWIILTLPPLHLADSLEGSLVAEFMLTETNNLLAQLEGLRVKICFGAGDRETLRINT